ncbi:LysR family transcriptional regulator [Rhodococcus sp. 06-418-5]|uniref:LysR substrate-binding domain-containing protein n=1 Tax=Rhodococcus cercidiphylli TaxID=489916 RepID=A0ABU4AWM8_9NOCA|nr:MULTISPECIES: LysR substrate-binding domain-containing protein [Rhodococcus]MDV6230637.1 LysR substrate-binding domain-containing protein [Rhodococcus cercidiphylli]OZC67900.1 LysR family transcriptional regulator [Rhodococcus sp. 06-470-2]OZC85032.1 LysR family transcriptional regulator [Rhodococcus sp. 06-418-5]OZC85208.1 LysR family transcriptional regulator [Rhodococcus sp. 06-418-5]OZE62417.1 LysR family transcriptional regulator [Rhodococcus sp. 05-2221-1B]
MNLPLELRPLSYFVAVAEELHFGKAAARLHIAQPSLSVQIRKLEHSLGTALFIRDSRHVSLTPAGDKLLEGSRQLLADAERVASLTRQVGRSGRNNLIVGFQANAAAELTPDILSAFRALHPDVAVEMQSFDFTDPYVGLGDGSVDVAFVRPPVVVQDWLALETLFVEPRVLVVASTSPLAQQDSTSVEEVAGQPFVARRSPESWRDFWLAVSSRDGETVRLGAEVSTVDECFEAILSSKGVAFSQASTQRFYARPGLAFVPVTGIPPTPLSIGWRSDVDSPLTRDFVAAARRVAVDCPVPNSWAPPTAGVPSLLDRYQAKLTS